jgi:hypothetical protein
MSPLYGFRSHFHYIQKPMVPCCSPTPVPSLCGPHESMDAIDTDSLLCVFRTSGDGWTSMFGLQSEQSLFDR